MLRHGNYYGPGWSGGQANFRSLQEYLEVVARTPAVDELDRVAKYHDLGMAMASLNDPETGRCVESVVPSNWITIRQFWRIGGWRGYVGAIGLLGGLTTGLTRCYAGLRCCRSTPTFLQLQQLRALYYQAALDLPGN